jgi:aquaporin Z
MRIFTSEFIGTFFLILTIGCTGIASGPGVIPPLAIGAILMTMVYAGGHLSGAHFNPAITVAAWVRGATPTRDVATYFIAQTIGAVAAAAIVLFLKAAETVTAFTPHPYRAFAAEFLFTFALAWVVLNAATVKSLSANSYYGLAIGFTVLAGAFAVGDISGGAFNPAVAIGAMVMGLLPWGQLWLYLIAEIAGGALAALVFRSVVRE